MRWRDRIFQNFSAGLIRRDCSAIEAKEQKAGEDGFHLRFGLAGELQCRRGSGLEGSGDWENDVELPLGAQQHRKCVKKMATG
jgi:hypothetical protein